MTEVIKTPDGKAEVGTRLNTDAPPQQQEQVASEVAL